MSREVFLNHAYVYGHVSLSRHEVDFVVSLLGLLEAWWLFSFGRIADFAWLVNGQGEVGDLTWRVLLHVVRCYLTGWRQTLTWGGTWSRIQPSIAHFAISQSSNRLWLFHKSISNLRKLRSNFGQLDRHLIIVKLLFFVGTIIFIGSYLLATIEIWFIDHYFVR